MSRRKGFWPAKTAEAIAKLPLNEPQVRHPIGFANYSGDCRNILNEGMKGPNYMGEAMWAVSAEYDSETNKTRVGFSLIPPREDNDESVRIV